MWSCLCDCGGQAKVSTKKLKYGITTNCGCMPKPTAAHGSIAEDIKGQRFGMLTAVSREESKDGKTQWLCVCDCGKTRVVATYLLKARRTWHCGCKTVLLQTRPKLDLCGKRFGRLRVVKSTEKRTGNGSVIWECICDCGNMIEAASDSLMNGNIISCGCRKQELMDSIGDYLTFVDGTCVEWLRSRKHRNDNTSGFRGVSKTRNGTWRASIGFKSQRYHIGTFKTFEEAKAARQKAEEILHDGFVLAWEKWNALAFDEPGWVESNPFIFDVHFEHGEFIVNTSALTKAEGQLDENDR